ncbi:MAG: hypothetical protein ABI143_10630 [Caldimonas sp.]
MRQKPFRRGNLSSGASQSGVVLFVALIVLIVMTLAGLGLLRQMSAGNAIAGNVAFKENATSTADAGTEAARQWLIDTAATNLASLNADVAASGYFSTWAGGVDPTQYDWTQSGSNTLDASTGSRVRYIIHRLCETAGLDPADPSQRCSDRPGGPNNAGGVGYGTGSPSAFSSPIPFYRITTRVDGARNTISYTQVLMY